MRVDTAETAAVSVAPAASSRVARDGEIGVRGARIAYRQWGSDTDFPVLALHGWLDNAASFDALAPQLEGYRVIAVDLPGHGRSSHRSADGSYNIWDDLPDLVALVREFGLQRYGLLGHSRGAVIATLMAAIEAPAVSSMVLLDGIIPPPFDAADTVKQLRTYAHDYGLRAPRAAHVFATSMDAVDARCKATGIDRGAAGMLVARSLEQAEGGFRWCTDARLRYASALKFGQEHVRNVLGSLQLPGLLIAASGSDPGRIADHPSIAWYRALEVVHIEGCHHCHMLAQSRDIAAYILKFWRAL